MTSIFLASSAPYLGDFLLEFDLSVAWGLRHLLVR